MLIVVTVPVSPALAESLADGVVVCRADLHAADEGTLAGAVGDLRPNVLVTDRPVGREVLRCWREAMGDEPLAVVRIVASAGGVPGAPGTSERRLPTMRQRPVAEVLPFDVPLYTVTPLSGGEEDAGAYEALAVAERFAQEREREAAAGAPRPAVFPSPFPSPARGRGTVLMIGAGIVNLMTAHALHTDGYRVTIVDAAPDPRAARPWTEYGASRGGGNARMFTYTEMDDYHAKSPDDLDSMTVFDRPPARLGWDVRRHDTEQDRQWVQDFQRVPPWLARAYNGDILGLNRRSGELWQTWLRTRPQLFDDVELRHDILRLYQDPAHLAAARRRQDAVGATIAAYSGGEVRERFPALARAAAHAFAGGVLVEGFTVNVHDTMARLLDDLEAGGVRLHFGLRVEEIMRDGDGDGEGVVTGVLTTDGPLLYDHYVLSPGADDDSLRRQIPVLRQVNGVLGCWATIPNTDPALGHSLKVARRGHVAEDANVTVGRDESGRPVLMVGSGYGWTGADPHNIDERRLEDIHAGIADTVRLLFPDAYESVGGREGLRRTQKHCVRPWTASNLGLFETIAARNGAFVVTAGHNTGGFAQAPVIAEAVAHALQGIHHPMHTLYHPQRTDRAVHVPQLGRER
ncbi:FAD-dependent oxidoreductase [Kitasatospora sp. NPDC093806]|uniref:NAD(P)/FAD-dependent oxidoreductase n=1 Tax=Kitasatospora sp. NPDC093806 TaxID=3155075 RepID=UPI00343B20DF